MYRIEARFTFESHSVHIRLSQVTGRETQTKIFKAVNMEEVAGIRIGSTSNLTDHLSMEGPKETKSGSFITFTF